MRPEGLCHRKIPMTPSGIEPTTCRFVAFLSYVVKENIQLCKLMPVFCVLSLLFDSCPIFCVCTQFCAWVLSTSVSNSMKHTDVMHSDINLQFRNSMIV